MICTAVDASKPIRLSSLARNDGVGFLVSRQSPEHWSKTDLERAEIVSRLFLGTELDQEFSQTLGFVHRPCVPKRGTVGAHGQ